MRLDALFPHFHPSARENVADRPRDKHADSRIQNTVERIADVGSYRRIEQQNAQHNAAGLHAADPEHLAKHDQNDRSDERQRNQPKRVFSGRLYEQVQTEKHHAQQTADQRAEQTISAVLAGILHVRTHAKNRADARERRAAVKKVIDERAESRRQCGLDVAHPHAGDFDGFQRHVLPPEFFVETAAKRRREPARPSPSAPPI